MILKLADDMLPEVAAGRRKVDVRPCRIEEARPGNLMFQGRRDGRHVIVDVVHAIHCRLKDIPREFFPELAVETHEELARNLCQPLVEDVTPETVVTLLTFVPTGPVFGGG